MSTSGCSKTEVLASAECLTRSPSLRCSPAAKVPGTSRGCRGSKPTRGRDPGTTLMAPTCSQGMLQKPFDSAACLGAELYFECVFSAWAVISLLHILAHSYNPKREVEEFVGTTGIVSRPFSVTVKLWGFLIKP